MLDSNIYHHFIFLVRLFDFDSREKTQRFEVLVPQEDDSGVLKVSELRRAEMELRGRNARFASSRPLPTRFSCSCGWTRTVSFRR